MSQVLQLFYRRDIKNCGARGMELDAPLSGASWSMSNCRTVLLGIVGAIMSLCICGCGISSYTYLVSTDRIEKDRTHLSMVEKVVGRKRSPTGRISANGIDVLIQPSNAIRISQQTRHILLVFSSVHKINQEEYRFPPFYYENSTLDTRDSFIVEFLFSTGSHEATFNAMALVLEDDNGNKHHPVSVYTLVPTPVHPGMSFSDRAIAGRSSFLCGIPKPDAELAFHRGRPAVLKKYERKPPDPVHLGKGGLYCFAVKFSIPPLDPRLSFIITMNDLRVDGLKMPVPGIYFVPDTYVDVTP